MEAFLRTVDKRRRSFVWLFVIYFNCVLPPLIYLQQEKNTCPHNNTTVLNLACVQ